MPNPNQLAEGFTRRNHVVGASQSVTGNADHFANQPNSPRRRRRRRRNQNATAEYANDFASAVAPWMARVTRRVARGEQPAKNDGFWDAVRRRR